MVITYTVLIQNKGYTMNLSFATEEDLLQLYKDAIINKSEHLTWKNGCLRISEIIGIHK